jgi:uncharacterized GH25 family protein
MGEPLTVRAMYKGKPVAGAIIMSDYVNDPDEAGVKTGPMAPRRSSCAIRAST